MYRPCIHEVPSWPFASSSPGAVVNRSPKQAIYNMQNQPAPSPFLNPVTSYPIACLPHWNRQDQLGRLHVTHESQIRERMGHLFSQYQRAFPWRFPGFGSENVVIGSTSRYADDTLGTFTSSEMYPNNSTLCDRWVTIGLFQYKKVPAPNTTFAQTLEAVAERAAPMIHLDYESSEPIGSQIVYSIAEWLEYKKLLPHAPIYGVSVVGYSFRRIIAFSPDEIYVDIHPSYQQGAIDHTNPIHWKDMEFERHQLSFDRLMYLISATVYRIEHLDELAAIQVPGRTAPNAHLAQRLLMPVRSGVFHSEIYGHRDSTLRLGTAETAASKIKRKDEGGNGEITNVEATSSTRLTASDSTGSVGTSSTSSGSHGSLAVNNSSVWSMTKEQLTFDWPSTEEQPTFDDAELSQYQNHLLTIAKPLASMSIQHQLQLFDFVGDRARALEMAADFIKF